MIIFEGKSRLTGEPVAVIATGVVNPSRNPKTGPVIQTYILGAETHPVEALRSGADAAICGDCRFRPSIEGGCYVSVAFAPARIWRTYKAGGYERARPADVGRGRMVRIGSYGDPGAIPTRVWRELISESIGHTGYSHLWRRRPSLRGICMASCDDLADLADAQRRGWRAYVVLPKGADLPRGAARCPASAEAGHATQCVHCMACDGAQAKRHHRSIAIEVH